MKKTLQSFIEILICFLSVITVWFIIKYQDYAVYLYISFGIYVVILHLFNSLFLELMILLTSLFVGIFFIVMSPKIVENVFMFFNMLTLIFWYILLSKIDKNIEKKNISFVEEEERLAKECSEIELEIEKKQKEIYNSMIKIQNYKSVEEFVNKLTSLSTLQQIRDYVAQTFAKMFHNYIIKVYLQEKISDPVDEKLVSYADKNVVYCQDIVSFFSSISSPSSLAIKDTMIKQGIRSFIYIRFWQENTKEVLGYLILYSKEQINEDRFRLISLLSSFVNIAVSNIKLFEYTKELAITDSLTGLYVQKYFKELLREEIKIARFYNKPLSVAMFDVDNFKQINDTYGHNIGDEVLVKFANILRSRLRETDVIVRYGGDEFAVMFTNTEVKNAKIICEELRNLVVKETLVLPRMETCKKSDLSPRIKFYVSCGVAQYVDRFTNEEEFINYVDTLLYKAKKSGKNKVVAG